MNPKGKKPRILVSTSLVILGLLALVAFSGSMLQTTPFQNVNQMKSFVLSAGEESSTDSQIKQFQILTVNSGPNAIISAPNDTFWFVEFSAGKLGEFSALNDSFKEFLIPENRSTPASLALDHLGRIWFSDQSGSGSIWRFDPATLLFKQYRTLTPNSTPLFILIDDRNNVWFTETTQNRLGVLNYPSYDMSEYPLPSSNSGPVELAFGQNQSTIWITETFTGKIASSAQVPTCFRSLLPRLQIF